MPVSSTHRWIYVGSLRPRRQEQVSPGAPIASVAEAIEIARSRVGTAPAFREHGSAKSRLMWFSNFVDHEDFYLFLVEVGDQNATGVSFIDFKTRETRDVAKLDDEGTHFTAHVAIVKMPTETGCHIVLVERVPGVYLASLREHFAWLSKDQALLKPYTDEAGKERKSRTVFEIDGHQSRTIRDALKTGILQDVEFIKTVKEPDGLDEVEIVKETINKATWEVKQMVTDEQANRLFGKMRTHFRDTFCSDEGDAHMFVRIKTGAGQIKRTEVPDNEESVLEQAFVHNELIGDFATPLEQRYAGLRDDVVEKILAIAKRLSQETGGEAA